MYVHYFSLQLGKRPIRVPLCSYWGRSIFGFWRPGSLVSPSTHLSLSLISVYLVIPSFVYVSTFFPKSRTKKEHVSKIRFLKAASRTVSQEIQKHLRETTPWRGGGGGCTPFFNAFLQTAFITTTKRHVGNVSPLKVHSLLSSEQVLAALSNRYHLDIFNSLCCPQSHLQTVNWRSGVSKTWNLRLPGGISLFPSNFSK